MKMKPTLLSGAIALSLTATSLTQADTFVESTDAGITEAGAVTLPPNTTQINGTLKAGTLGPFSGDPVDVDVYCFTISESVPLPSIQVTGAFNTNILILREGFFGVEGNDGAGNDSQVSALLTAGTYYIAIGQENIAAFPFAATIVGDETWDNDTGQVPGPERIVPIQFIGARQANPTDTTGQAYTVTLGLGGVPVSITGIDQGAGKRLKNLKGIGIANSSGREQIAKIRGSGRFNILMKNSGANRSIRTTVKRNVSRLDFKVIAIGKGRKNITAKLRARGFKRTVASGDSITYKVSVNKGQAPSLRKKFLLKTVDQQDKSIGDTAGAKVVLK